MMLIVWGVFAGAAAGAAGLAAYGPGATFLGALIGGCFGTLFAVLFLLARRSHG